MLDFRQHASRKGPRPHVFLRPRGRLQAATDALLSYPGPLDEWSPGWQDRLDVVPPAWRHITVVSIDIPTADLAPGAWEHLTAALTEALAYTPPVQMKCTGAAALPGSVALTVGVHGLSQLTAKVTTAAHSALGPEVSISPGWRQPHIAVAYSRANWADPPFTHQPGPAVDWAEAVWLVSWDSLTSAPVPGLHGGSWDPSTARKIPLRGLPR